VTRQSGTRSSAEPAWACFVGRDRELEELEAALAGARAGHGTFVLVAGEPGIGKTSLVSELAERAAAGGTRVVWGRSWDGGGAPPFWPWGRVVDELCRGRDPGWLADAAGVDPRRLVAMAPGLADRVEPDAAPASEQARFAMLHALVAVVRAASAEEPLLLALDDVDAAGVDALLALEFVSRELRDAPVLGVATFKEEVVRRRPEAEAILGRLARTCRRIDLTGLPDGEVGLLLEQMTGVPPALDLVRAVGTLAAGNPFFAGEIVRTLAAETGGREDFAASQLPLPSGVRDAITRRTASLPAGARDVLAPAAVIGREFRIAILERAVALERTELLEALDQALAAGLITRRPAGAGFAFAHGLVRETIYAGLGSVERSGLHRAVGEAIEQVHRGELEQHLAELAHHFFEAAVAGEAERAVDYSQRAGRRAMRALAWDEAARLFGQALAALELGDADPSRRAELLVELGRAQVHSGAAEARETLRTAAGCATTVERPDLLALAALDFGSFALSPGIVDEEVVRLLEQALASLDPGDSALRVRLLARLAVALYWSPDTERRLDAADEAVAIARRLGERPTLAYALANRQAATSSPERTEECVQTALEVFRLTDAAADLELELPVRVRQIGHLLELDDIAGADVAIETLERLAAGSHDPRAQAYVPLERSRRMALEGRFEEAERLTGEAGRLGEGLRDSTIPMQAAAQMIGMRWAGGRMGEVREQLRRFADGYPAMPVYRAALALACCEAGRAADARREYRSLATHDFDGIPRDSVWLLSMAFLSETCGHLGDEEGAAVLYDLLSPFAGRNVVSPDAIFAGPVARYLGILASTRGDRAAAEAHFEAAWEQASLDSARPEMLRTRLDHARMLASAGDGGRAAGLLDDAQALAEELGLGELLERIAGVREESGEPATAAPAPAAEAEPLVAGMQREGEVWRLEYGGRVIHVRDSKGQRNLAVLLGAPGVDIPAAEIEVLAGGSAGPAVRAGAAVAAEGLSAQAGDAPLAALDATAKSEYRRRLEDLREEVEQAEEWGDPERAARAREEMELIGSELAAAVGLGGRDRPQASGAERARVRVTRTIHSAIRRIAEQDEALGYELGATIRTGSFCAYEPDPRRPVRWLVESG
jgi:tetratricopeptide (TPR) repeat protein